MKVTAKGSKSDPTFLFLTWGPWGPKNSLEDEEQAGGDQDEAQRERQDAALLRRHDPPPAVEAVLSRENLPFPPRSSGPPGRGVGWGDWGRRRNRLQVGLLGITALHDGPSEAGKQAASPGPGARWSTRRGTRRSPRCWLCGPCCCCLLRCSGPNSSCC